MKIESLPAPTLYNNEAVPNELQLNDLHSGHEFQKFCPLAKVAKTKRKRNRERKLVFKSRQFGRTKQSGSCGMLRRLFLQRQAPQEAPPSRGAAAGLRGRDPQPAASLCARFCQLPLGAGAGARPDADAGTARRSLVAEAGTARRSRLRSVMRGARREDDELKGLSALRRKERLEERALEQYLLPELQEGEFSGLSEGLRSDVGETCDICSINPATHFALPCNHRACKVCWGRWLAEHQNCMTCTNHVRNIQRYPQNVLPLTSYEVEEADSLRKETILIDQTMERCVRSMLAVKDALGGVVIGLEEIEKHLFNITRPAPGQVVTIESLTTVLAVERSSVLEQLQAMDEIFGKKKEWENMDEELELLSNSVTTFNKLLDEFLDESAQREAKGMERATSSDELLLKDVEDNGDDADGSYRPPSVPLNDQGQRISKFAVKKAGIDTKVSIEIFEILVAKTSLVSQWTRLREILDKCGPESNLMMGLMRIFGMIHISHVPNARAEDIPTLAARVISKAQEKTEKTDSHLTNKLIPDAELTLERLRSM